MNKSLLSFINTGVLSLVLLGVFFLISFNVTNSLNNDENEKLIKLSKNEADILLAKELLNKFEYFRNSYVDVDSIDNLDMIKYIFDNLSDKDYSIKEIKPVKVDCTVNSKIKFTKGGICKVLVIKNKSFDDYRNLIFKYDKDIEFVDFKYKGYECKNDSKSYYCLINDYEETNNEYKVYSLVDSAFKSDDKIILYEYYLVDNGDYESCSKYYGDVYCTLDYEGDLPALKDDVLKKYGVYYRHEFIKEDNRLYLDKSFIVNE